MFSRAVADCIYICAAIARLPNVPGMPKKKGRPSKADIARREAYAAQLAAGSAAARAVPDSPASSNKHKRINSPAAAPADLVSPDVSISSAETMSQPASHHHRPGDKALAGKHNSTADTVETSHTDPVPDKAKPKRGRAPQDSKQDKAALALHAEQAVGSVQGSHELEADAIGEAVPEATAAALQPKAKRKKTAPAGKSAVPLASAKASSVELHKAPESPQLNSDGSQPPVASYQAPADDVAPIKALQEFTCARARPWTKPWPSAQVNEAVNPTAGAAADVTHQAPTAAQAAPVAAPVAAPAAPAAKVADSKGHVGSTGRPQGVGHDHDSSAQPAAEQHQSSEVQPPMARADALQSPTSKPAEEHAPDPQGQMSNEPHGQLSHNHTGPALDTLPYEAGGHTAESSGTMPASMKSSKHAAPAGERSKSSHRGGHVTARQLLVKHHHQWRYHCSDFES